MSTVISFLVGIAAGSALMWQVDKRAQRRRTRWLGKSAVLATVQTNPAAPAAAPRDAAAVGSEAPGETAEAQEAASPMPSTSDPLEHIKGIEPAYARRLQEAGIMTFADLAALPPERVTEIVASDDPSRPLIDPQDWIAQARALVGSDEPAA
ncbi:hypothetical protein NKDENANG_03697 [Candidatus Entotheonellaceae bacterium PAL068K]